MDLGGVERAAGPPHADAVAAERRVELEDAAHGLQRGDDGAAGEDLHRLIADRLAPSHAEGMAQAGARKAVHDQQVRQVEGGLAAARRQGRRQHEERRGRRRHREQRAGPMSEDDQVGKPPRTVAAPEVAQRLPAAGQLGRGVDPLGGERRGQIARGARRRHQKPEVQRGRRVPAQEGDHGTPGAGARQVAEDLAQRLLRRRLGGRPEHAQRAPPPDLGHGRDPRQSRRSEDDQLDGGRRDPLLEELGGDPLDDVDLHLGRRLGRGAPQRRDLLVQRVELHRLRGSRPGPGPPRRGGRDPQQLAVRRDAPEGRKRAVARLAQGRQEQDATKAHGSRTPLYSWRSDASGSIRRGSPCPVRSLCLVCRARARGLCSQRSLWCLRKLGSPK